jgi:3-oxoacyl-[acyl-carrier protein] reductase
MDLELTAKRAVVTGASRGLGRAVALALASEGASVLGIARHPDGLAALAAEGIAVAEADLTTEAGGAALRQAVLAGGAGLDILVCNIGSGSSVPPGEETVHEWRRMLDVNLFTAINAIEAVRKLMRPGGAIVCISSITGLRALGAPVPYSAAKAALNSLVANLARPLAAEGVRIVGVAPGNLIFNGSVWERKLFEDAEGVHAMLARDVALGRLGRPEEIASAVAFLSSNRASFLTGTVIVADGGQTGIT